MSALPAAVCPRLVKRLREFNGAGRALIDVPDDTSWTGRRRQFVWQINHLSHIQFPLQPDFPSGAIGSRLAFPEQQSPQPQ